MIHLWETCQHLSYLLWNIRFYERFYWLIIIAIAVSELCDCKKPKYFIKRNTVSLTLPLSRYDPREASVCVDWFSICEKGRAPTTQVVRRNK